MDSLVLPNMCHQKKTLVWWNR